MQTPAHAHARNHASTHALAWVRTVYHTARIGAAAQYSRKKKKKHGRRPSVSGIAPRTSATPPAAAAARAGPSGESIIPRGTWLGGCDGCLGTLGYGREGARLRWEAWMRRTACSRMGGRVALLLFVLLACSHGDV
jgi:hypothetical protein